MVKEIKEDGRLSISLIGGFTYNAIEGEYCEIQTDSGQVYTERFVCMKQVSMFTEIIMKYLEMANIWKFVSMKTTSDQETRDLGIEVGDFVSFDPRTEITSSGFIKSRHLDDKSKCSNDTRTA